MYALKISRESSGYFSTCMLMLRHTISSHVSRRPFSGTNLAYLVNTVMSLRISVALSNSVSFFNEDSVLHGAFSFGNLIKGKLQALGKSSTLHLCLNAESD